jgi:hypothetical protein
MQEPGDGILMWSPERGGSSATKGSSAKEPDRAARKNRALVLYVVFA